MLEGIEHPFHGQGLQRRQAKVMHNFACGHTSAQLIKHLTGCVVHKTLLHPHLEGPVENDVCYLYLGRATSWDKIEPNERVRGLEPAQKLLGNMDLVGAVVRMKE